MTRPPPNRALASVYARYFLRHLREELLKPAEMLDKPTSKGRPFRESLEEMIEKVLREFPEVADAPEAPYNLFEKWANMGKESAMYQLHTFRLQNEFFFARIMGFRDRDAASRRLIRDAVNAILAGGKFYESNYTFPRFYRSEGALRECMREIIDEHPELPQKECKLFLLEQGEIWMESAFRYYDRLLKGALDESERLLLNILPREVSRELKAKGQVEPVLYPAATVLFTDFQGFTRIAEKMAPRDLIRELDNCFSYFDRVTERNHLEKIKTIGDAYMCVGGLPRPRATHAVDAVLAALEIQDFMNQMKRIKADLNEPYWELRLGIHSGPLVAGVIGEKKFTYDIWGDTVNTASRLESAGATGRINISAATRDAVGEYFITEHRGTVAAKNKGEIDMYFVERIRPEFSQDEAGRVPNETFRALLAESADNPAVG